VKGTPSVWRGAFLRTVALGVALAVVPLPVVAAEASPPATPVNLHASIVKAASTNRLASAPVAAQQGQTAASDPKLQSGSFFKTPLGIAVIGVVGAGAAYAVYSASHDRIHSPYPR